MPTPIITCALLLVLSQIVAASEYLPPPDGPYQSSVVINAENSESGAETQTYRFPPADLLPPPSNRMPPPDLPLTPDPLSEAPFDLAPAADPRRAQRGPGGSADYGAGSFEMPVPANPPGYANPWATPAPAPSSQGNWQNPYGGYIYPYNYGGQYGNVYPYNRSAPPFNYMPSPWSMMPAQPYSGN